MMLHVSTIDYLTFYGYFMHNRAIFWLEHKMPHVFSKFLQDLVFFRLKWDLIFVTFSCVCLYHMFSNYSFSFSEDLTCS